MPFLTVRRQALLETPRLCLRPMEPGHLNSLVAVLSDPIARRYFPAPLTRGTVLRWIERSHIRHQQYSDGLWAILLKETAIIVGDCELLRSEAEGQVTVELSYHVRQDARRQSYATEAARACIRYSFEKIGASKVIAVIRRGNIASRRVAEKNGMKLEREIMRAGFVHLVYASSKL
ncbi:MAG TPA: GNAT family N-acetyltransferase [Candidatus Acidoferrales bacterium]|nr:GNAT family N-acetyltransferase [Candidatus Acidoferrales bacterium]